MHKDLVFNGARIVPCDKSATGYALTMMEESWFDSNLGYWLSRKYGLSGLIIVSLVQVQPEPERAR